MYGSLLSALFLGMLPFSGTHIAAQLVTLEDVEVARPAEPLVLQSRLSASGVAVFDVQSGQMVYGFGSEVERPMASLTKLMTALIIAENHDMDEWVRIPESAAYTKGNRAYLPPRNHFTVGDLLSAALIRSANDAAETLAVYHSGSIEAFVEEMNARAKSLGLQNTSYVNASGMDVGNQYSTPKDIAWLTLFALRNPEIRERMGKTSERIVSREGHVIILSHTHELLYADNAVIAGKTGTTLDAGECLVSLVEEGDREYLVVLLHSLQRYEDMRSILMSLTPSALITARNG